MLPLLFFDIVLLKFKIFLYFGKVGATILFSLFDCKLIQVFVFFKHYMSVQNKSCTWIDYAEIKLIRSSTFATTLIPIIIFLSGSRIWFYSFWFSHNQFICNQLWINVSKSKGLNFNQVDTKIIQQENISKH